VRSSLIIESFLNHAHATTVFSYKKKRKKFQKYNGFTLKFQNKALVLNLSDLQSKC
jgi:hypothetical protein